VAVHPYPSSSRASRLEGAGWGIGARETSEQVKIERKIWRWLGRSR
jgi:hypothetical protein